MPLLFLSVSKNMSLRTSPQAGVAISEVFRLLFNMFTAKTGGIPTPVCALARNDTTFLTVCKTGEASPLLFLHFAFSILHFLRP